MKRNGNITNWKKDDWEVQWYMNMQHYEVYYKGRLFSIEYRFANVECYIK